MPKLYAFVAAILSAALLVVANPEPAAASSDGRSAVVQFARDQLGKPYRLGATGLQRYDCSGLVYRAFLETGQVHLIGGSRRTARWYFQYFRDRGLVTNNPQPGDLVAWGKPVSHMGIFRGYGGAGRPRAISALVNPWGVTDHRVDWINLPFRAYLRVPFPSSGPSASPISSSGYSMALRAGGHNLFRLSSNGSILEQRRIERSSILRVATNGNIRMAGGRPHAQIQSGRWEGWWRRVPESSGSSLHRFGQTRTLRLQPGNHLLKTFHANNRVVIRYHLSVDQRTHFDVEYRATFNGKRHFLIASGPHAGRWVVKSSNSRLVPLSETATAPEPSGAQASWRVAMLIYTNLDATCGNQRVRNSLSATERQNAIDRSEWFARRINNWSNGMAEIELTYRFPGTVTQATRLSSGHCWVSHQDVRDMGHWPSGFDSVYVQEPMGLHPHGGLAWDGFLPWGSTYGTSPAWSSNIWYGTTTEGVNIILHEWLHGAGGFYRNHFGEGRVPDLHNERAYGYTKDTDWYRDFLRGTINGSLGLTHEVWSFGTPMAH